MTDLRQAAQQALKALEDLQGGCTDSDDGTVEALTVWCPEVITALRKALEQPEQEPVACRFCHDKKGCWTWQCYSCGEIDDVQKPAPPAAQRPWQGLTDEDKQTAVWTNGTFGGGALWAEAMLKERNNG